MNITTLRGYSRLLSVLLHQADRLNEQSPHHLLLPHLSTTSLNQRSCLADCQHPRDLSNSAEAILPAADQQMCHDPAATRVSSHPTWT